MVSFDCSFVRKKKNKKIKKQIFFISKHICKHICLTDFCYVSDHLFSLIHVQ